MQETKKEKKPAEPKKPREVRRLETQKKEILDKLVLSFFTQRSVLADPEGEEATAIFSKLDHEWHRECKNFNVRRKPIKLRYETFAESVEFYLKMEKDQMIKSAETNKEIGFSHWFRRSHPYLKHPFKAIWYEVISLFNRDKVLNYWKQYYKLQQNDNQGKY